MARKNKNERDRECSLLYFVHQKFSLQKFFFLLSFLFFAFLVFLRVRTLHNNKKRINFRAKLPQENKHLFSSEWVPLGSFVRWNSHTNSVSITIRRLCTWTGWCIVDNVSSKNKNNASSEKFLFSNLKSFFFLSLKNSRRDEMDKYVHVYKLQIIC